MLKQPTLTIAGAPQLFAIVHNLSYHIFISCRQASLEPCAWTTFEDLIQNLCCALLGERKCNRKSFSTQKSSLGEQHRFAKHYQNITHC